MFILLTCFSGLVVCFSACKTKTEKPVAETKSELQKKS